MIKLGVSACFMYPDPARVVFGKKTLTYLETDMSRFLSRKNIMPVLLPDVPWEQLETYLQEMDAFVFQGGADISPLSYKETLIENGRWPGDSYRDQYELKIMDWAFKNKKPILGICRGFQLMNVYFGGTLYQDLKLQTKTEIEHRNAELYDQIFHEVECTPGSLLEKIYGQKKLWVNSVHHQGVKTLGKDLVVDAHCPQDQLIEAFHHKNMNENLVLAVQWHPEFSHTIQNKVINPEPLLNYFLERFV
ncbi:MAG: gamma-glutamyl-gamma-aminobutyrate hydrolase family protein [Pseudobdellovibrionaceae bacterium]